MSQRAPGYRIWRKVAKLYQAYSRSNDNSTGEYSRMWKPKVQKGSNQSSWGGMQEGSSAVEHLKIKWARLFAISCRPSNLRKGSNFSKIIQIRWESCSNWQESRSRARRSIVRRGEEVGTRLKGHTIPWRGPPIRAKERRRRARRAPNTRRKTKRLRLWSSPKR